METMLRRALALIAVALCVALSPASALAGQVGGGLASSGANRSSALTANQIAGKAGAFFALDPSQGLTLTLSGANVTAANDAIDQSMVLTAGTTPFLYDSTHLLAGHACIATSGSGSGYGLFNTAYSPVNTAGAAASAWADTPWTMLAVVDVESLASLGGGPFIGQQSTRLAQLGIGGTAFGAGAAGDVFYATDNGAAVSQWAFPGVVPQTMIVSLSYDGAGAGARVRHMLNGAVDSADGAAVGSMSVAQPGFGLVEAFSGGTAALTRYYRVYWFAYNVPRPTLRAIQRALAGEFGLVTTTTSLIAIGDSMTFGFVPPSSQLPQGQQWPFVMGTALTGAGKNVAAINLGASGSKASGWYGATTLAYTIEVANSALPKATWAVIWLGHNDLALDSATAATVIARLQSVIAEVQFAGYNVALLTIPASSVFTTQQNTDRATVNAWVRASPYVVVDVDALPDSQTPGNTTFYFDGVHPTAALDAEIGALAAQKIGPHVQWVVPPWGLLVLPMSWRRRRAANDTERRKAA